MIFTKNNDIPSKILSETQEKEMIFLGEYLHHIPAINKYIEELVVTLAKKSEFRILAKESVYCLYPHFEKNSLYGIESSYFGNTITNHNRSSKNNKVIVTAIDLAHSIKHSPALVKEFILETISNNLNSEILEIFNKCTRDLDKLKSINEKEEFLQVFQTKLNKHKNILDPAIFEELQFYSNLLVHSLKHTQAKDENEFIKLANDRNKWFIKTIDRSISRNKKYGLKMICHVGSPHAYKKYIHKSQDYYVGEIPEAQYFNEVNYPGKIYSILIRPFFLDYYGNTVKKISNPIENEAYKNIGQEKSIFVDLSEFRNNYNIINGVQYYDSTGFQYDGIIYIKKENL